MSTGIQNSDGKVMEEGKGPPECRRGRRDGSKREADGRRGGGAVYAHHRFETNLMQYWMTSMRSSAVWTLAHPYPRLSACQA